MEKINYNQKLAELDSQIKLIQNCAHKIHHDVNQFYDKDKPYAYHLDMVAENAIKYGHLIISNDKDILPLLFGAWFHDSIEDARLTYNDVRKIALELGLDESQAFCAVEIVYALTNDKGRTRNERAGEKYYAGIRETPYAPFVKMCDRMANMRHSMVIAKGRDRMAGIYIAEMPHFLSSIKSQKTDLCYSIPQEMLHETEVLIRQFES